MARFYAVDASCSCSAPGKSANFVCAIASLLERARMRRIRRRTRCCPHLWLLRCIKRAIWRDPYPRERCEQSERESSHPKGRLQKLLIYDFHELQILSAFADRLIDSKAATAIAATVHTAYAGLNCDHGSPFFALKIIWASRATRSSSEAIAQTKSREASAKKSRSTTS